MNKKDHIFSLTTLIFIATGSIAVILVLFMGNSDKANYRHNSFIRNIISNSISLSNVLDVHYNSYYIAGTTTNNLYFGNVTAPWLVLITNTTLADSQHVKLTTEGADDFEFQSIQVIVDSLDFYFIDGSIPVIFKGSLEDWYGYRQTYGSEYFMESKPINGGAFVMRTISSKTQESILGKQMNFYPYVKLAPELLEKQIDGKFCTDGMLHFSKQLNMLIYVYYYRNQFICADTSLNLLYRANTIDTVSRAKITVSEIQSNKSITLSSPPLLVNKKSCISGNRLFIHSNLLAKNEDKSTFESASVIDVYNLQNGEYQFSFYLPLYKGKKAREFQVADGMLIALYDNWILSYKLDTANFGRDNTANAKINHQKLGKGSSYPP